MKSYLGNTELFVFELLRMIDAGNSITIEEACQHIDDETIFDYIDAKIGYENINIKKEGQCNLELKGDVLSVLKGKYVSEREAEKWGFYKNGLVYIAYILMEDWLGCLWNMHLNDIDVESWRNS